MYQLYYNPGKASMTPHILLEELGVQYDLVLVDMANNMHKSEQFLALNPAGKIPVLVEDELVLSETIAICQHLSDLHPDAGMTPDAGTAARAKWYKWLAYLGTSLHPELLTHFFPHFLVDGEEAQGVLARKALERVTAMLDLIEAHLHHNAESGRGHWLLGAQYTAADIYLFMLARWTRKFTYPASARKHIGAFMQRVADRPAVQRACAAEGMSLPLF